MVVSEKDKILLLKENSYYLKTILSKIVKKTQLIKVLWFPNQTKVRAFIQVKRKLISNQISWHTKML